MFRKLFYIGPKETDVLTRRQRGNMWPAEEYAQDSLPAYSWRDIDSMMTWATKGDREWYKLGMFEIKEVFHSHANPVDHIIKNSSIRQGFLQIQQAHIKHRTITQAFINSSYRRSRKTAGRFRAQIF